VVKAVALRQLQRDREAASGDEAPCSSGDDAPNAGDASDASNAPDAGVSAADPDIAEYLRSDEAYQRGLSRMRGDPSASRGRGTPDQRSWAQRLASATASWGGVRDQRRGGRGARGNGATLAEFCRDLVAEARSGRLDTVSASSGF
jgi:hypothetical protein